MCGCSGKVSNGSRSSRVTKSTLATNSISSSSFNGCRSMYTELAELDIKVLELLRQNTIDSVLKESNTQIRVWIRNLGVECPPEEDYEILKEYIENEYAIHIQ